MRADWGGHMTLAHTMAPQLSRRIEAVLLSAVLVISLGYGVVLPVLPTIVAQLARGAPQGEIAQHIGLLTAVYVATPLVVAIAWGRVSDSIGRVPVLIVGLIGFAITLAATAFAPNLTALYVGRILNGGFAAAISPTALALISDVEGDEDRRARAFGAIGMASIAGFFFGPMLGGLTARWEDIAGAFGAGPFLSVAVLAVASAGTIYLQIPTTRPENPVDWPVGGRSQTSRREMVWLLVLAAVVAAGLGAFEVGLTLRTGARAMTPAHLAFLFATCSIVMFIAQGIVFSPLMKASATRWLVAPAFALMAIGMTFIPGVEALAAMIAAVSIVSASAGVIAPLLSYWVSRTAGRARGVGLGIQSAATSLGQSIGSAGAGLLYGLRGQDSTAFYVFAALLALAAVAAAALPRRLTPIPPDDKPIGRAGAGVASALPNHIKLETGDNP